MAEIGFYHLTRSTAEAALPILLGRTLAAGQRAVVKLASKERLAVLDQALWTCPSPDWLPHGTLHPALQPILLTTEDGAANGGRFLFLLDGVAAQLQGFDRVFDLFDGNDQAAVAAARTRWTASKAAGHTLAYWRQEAAGWKQAG